MNDKVMARTRELVKEFGWAVQGVGGTDDRPQWAYTIGLHRSFQHPEIAIVGIPIHTIQVILNDCGQRVADGEAFELGRRYVDLIRPAEGLERLYEVEFVQTAASVYLDWFGSANRFYGGLVPVWQLVWPDKAGRLPWEPGFTDILRAAQPVLGERAGS